MRDQVSRNVEEIQPRCGRPVPPLPAAEANGVSCTVETVERNNVNSSPCAGGEGGVRSNFACWSEVAMALEIDLIMKSPERAKDVRALTIKTDRG